MARITKLNNYKMNLYMPTCLDETMYEMWPSQKKDM